MENKKLIIINILTIVAFIIVVGLGLSKSKSTKENFSNIEPSEEQEIVLNDRNALNQTTLTFKSEFNYHIDEEGLEINEVDDVEEEEEKGSQEDMFIVDKKLPNDQSLTRPGTRGNTIKVPENQEKSSDEKAKPEKAKPEKAKSEKPKPEKPKPEKPKPEKPKPEKPKPEKPKPEKPKPEKPKPEKPKPENPEPENPEPENPEPENPEPENPEPENPEPENPEPENPEPENPEEGKEDPIENPVKQGTGLYYKQLKKLGDSG